MIPGRSLCDGAHAGLGQLGPLPRRERAKDSGMGHEREGLLDVTEGAQQEQTRPKDATQQISEGRWV